MTSPTDPRDLKTDADARDHAGSPIRLGDGAVDEAALSQWIDLRYSEGSVEPERVGLTRTELALLELALTGTPAEIESSPLDPASVTLIRRSARDLRRLQSLLREIATEVDDAFAEAVVHRSRASGEGIIGAPRWRAVAIGLIVVLAWVASSLLGGEGGVVLGALSALGTFGATAVLAASGLLGASWEGVGSAVAEWLTASPVNVALLLGVGVAASLLLGSLLRDRRRADATIPRD